MPREIIIAAPVFPRITEYLGAWAFEPSRFATAVEQLQRMDWPKHMSDGAAPLRSYTQLVPTGRDGQAIAVIQADGELMKQQSSMGGTSTVQLRHDIRQAARDPNVSAILLAIDSPGGTVAGTAELANEVTAARRAKPVWAQIEDLGASAAYWFASQADMVFANVATAMVGSVGTIWVWQDDSKKAEQKGVKTFVFSTGSLKGTGAPGTPMTDEQQAYIQGLVNDMQIPFDAAVQKGRGLKPAQMEAIKSGRTFLAPEALKLRLIDGIQPRAATLMQLMKAK
ncbi:S49 family peptidase [Zavarzinella formosa]|uniref:S49 family peptidase n=1 Tax=Zavarzinella formosa TaxID=360055 RepID=UPI0003072472|nr:S49 family peptidase [Zavarzinella formosa]